VKDSGLLDRETGDLLQFRHHLDVFSKKIMISFFHWMILDTIDEFFLALMDVQDF
jgi:hypothetical protein